MSPRTRIVLVGIVAVVVLAFVLEAVIETDREAVERRTLEMKDRFLAGDVPAVLEYLEPDAEMEGILGRRPLESAIPGYVARAEREVDGVSLNLRELAVEGQEATGAWTVTVRLKPDRMSPWARFRVRIAYRKDGDHWRIRHVTVEGS
jgi:hypothetical protein